MQKLAATVKSGGRLGNADNIDMMVSPCSRYHSYPNRLVNSKKPHIGLMPILYTNNAQAEYPTSDGRSLKSLRKPPQYPIAPVAAMPTMAVSAIFMNPSSRMRPSMEAAFFASVIPRQNSHRY